MHVTETGASFFGSACSSVWFWPSFALSVNAFIALCFWLASSFSVPTESHFQFATHTSDPSLIHNTLAFEHVLFVLYRPSGTKLFFLCVSYEIRAFLQWLSAAKTSHPLCSYTTSCGLPLYRTELHVCAC